jgi:hypothetical protein
MRQQYYTKMFRAITVLGGLGLLELVLISSLSSQVSSFRIVRNRRIVKSKFGLRPLLIPIGYQQNVKEQDSLTQICSLNDAGSSDEDENIVRRPLISTEFDTNDIQQFVIHSIVNDPYRYNLGVHSPLLETYGFRPPESIEANQNDYDDDDDDINDYCGVDEINCENECMIPEEYKAFTKDKSFDVIAYLGIRRV